MPPADSPRRGLLTRRADRELVAEQLMRAGEGGALWAFGALRRATEAAEACSHAPLPEGLRAPAAEAFDYLYLAEAPVSVPSDGAFHSVPLLRREGAARPLFVCVPRESKEVFRYVELDNPLGAPLLRGPCEVYLGEDFALTNELTSTPAGGTIRLGLGVEEAIKVAKNSRFREETTGMLGGGLSLHHSFTIELLSHLKEEAPIEVRERLPTVGDEEEEIKIAVGEVRPAWERYEPEEAPLEGGKRWKLRLAPGAKQELSVTYVIKIASKNELVGGNRREEG